MGHSSRLLAKEEKTLGPQSGWSDAMTHGAMSAGRESVEEKQLLANYLPTTCQLERGGLAGRSESLGHTSTLRRAARPAKRPCSEPRHDVQAALRPSATDPADRRKPQELDHRYGRVPSQCEYTSDLHRVVPTSADEMCSQPAHPPAPASEGATSTCSTPRRVGR